MYKKNKSTNHQRRRSTFVIHTWYLTWGLFTCAAERSMSYSSRHKILPLANLWRVFMGPHPTLHEQTVPSDEVEGLARLTSQGQGAVQRKLDRPTACGHYVRQKPLRGGMGGGRGSTKLRDLQSSYQVGVASKTPETVCCSRWAHPPAIQRDGWGMDEDG